MNNTNLEQKGCGISQGIEFSGEFPFSLFKKLMAEKAEKLADRMGWGAEKGHQGSG